MNSKQRIELLEERIKVAEEEKQTILKRTMILEHAFHMACVQCSNMNDCGTSECAMRNSNDHCAGIKCEKPEAWEEFFFEQAKAKFTPKEEVIPEETKEPTEPENITFDDLLKEG